MEYAQGMKRELDDRDCLSPERQNDTSSRAKRPKLERTFVSAWLDRYDWLRYDSELNVMFCDLCIQRRKSNAFTEGCQNFRRDNLNKHANTNDHRASVEQNYAGFLSNLACGPSSTGHGTPCTLNNLKVTSDQPSASVSSSKSSPSPRRSSISSSSETSLNVGPSMQSPTGTAANTPSPTPAHMPLPHNYIAGFRTLAAIHRPQPVFPGEINGHIQEKEDLPIVPNYLSNPVFPYATQPRQRMSNSETPMNLTVGTAEKKQTEHPGINGTTHFTEDDNELVLKARVAHSTETDFIEIELDLNKLTHEQLLTTLCQELGVNRKLVYKIRKLPDTIIRKDKDVKRLKNFQEMEIVLTNKAISDRLSENSRNYTPSVSPKHVDVVY